LIDISDEYVIDHVDKSETIKENISFMAKILEQMKKKAEAAFIEGEHRPKKPRTEGPKEEDDTIEDGSGGRPSHALP